MRRRFLFFALLLSFLPASVSSSAIADPSDALVASLPCPDRVNGVAFSPDGKLLAAAYGWSAAGGVRVWTVEDRSVMADLHFATDAKAFGERVAFSSDGKYLAAVNRSGAVRLWQVGNWKSPKDIIPAEGSGTGLRFSPDSRSVAFTSDSALVLYEISTSHTARVALPKAVVGVSYAPDGRSAVICMRNGIQFWDVESGKLARAYATNGLAFFCSVAPTGNFLISGGGAVYGNKSVSVRRISDDEELGELKEFRSGVFAGAVSHSGKEFAVSGGNYGPGGDLSLWDAGDLHQVAYVSYGKFPIMAVEFSPDDSLLAAGSHDGVVALYETNRLRGVSGKKQSRPMCGEILLEGDKFFIVPVAKIPYPLYDGFQYSWKLELVGARGLNDMVGTPVILEDWELLSSAGKDQVRVNGFRSLLHEKDYESARRNFIVIADVEYLNWFVVTLDDLNGKSKDSTYISKIYPDNSFVATNKGGQCLAYGQLPQDKAESFAGLKAKLVTEGLLNIPSDPGPKGRAGAVTRFIELCVDGVVQFRTTAFGMATSETRKKSEDLLRVFDLEKGLIDTILAAGKNVPSN